MQDQRIRLRHLDGAAIVIDGETVVQLHGAHIGEEQDIGRDMAHLERGGEVFMGDGSALRAESHGDAMGLCRLRQDQIERIGEAGAAGHRADQDRGAQGLAHEGERGIDLGEVELRQGAMPEAIALQACGQARKLDIFFKVDADVIGFAALDQLRIVG